MDLKPTKLKFSPLDNKNGRIPKWGDFFIAVFEK